jgi:hypothetical protein
LQSAIKFRAPNSSLVFIWSSWYTKQFSKEANNFVF